MNVTATTTTVVTRTGLTLALTDAEATQLRLVLDYCRTVPAAVRAEGKDATGLSHFMVVLREAMDNAPAQF